MFGVKLHVRKMDKHGKTKKLYFLNVPYGTVQTIMRLLKNNYIFSFILNYYDYQEIRSCETKTNIVNFECYFNFMYVKCIIISLF